MLLLVPFGSVFSKPILLDDLIVVTVCNMPSIIIYRNIKKNETNVVAALVFMTDRRYTEAANLLLKSKRENIKSLEASEFTHNKIVCGVKI